MYRWYMGLFMDPCYARNEIGGIGGYTECPARPYCYASPCYCITPLLGYKATAVFSAVI